MGWLFGWSSRAEVIGHLDRIVTDSGYRTIDKASTSLGRNLWVAVEKDDQSFVMLFLLSSSDNQWGYKDISEDMGPCEIDCPLRLLDATTGLGSFATEWRAKVRAYHAARATRSGKTFSDGQVVHIYGKPYTVAGRIKRSYRVVCQSTGQVFKASALKMELRQ